MNRRRSSPGKRPLDQCKPEEMIDVLLSRLKDNLLDESKKALLVVELEDLYMFFQKHPEYIDMFRTDLLEWRTFLKQSKEYMEDFFDKKLLKTKKIIQYVTEKTKIPQVTARSTATHRLSHYNRKTHKPPGWNPRAPEPKFYEILFRPGIRSIREYPISTERYGEQNKDIDLLHRLTAWLREEIIYAPLTKVPRKTKEELLDILISVVQISAYDVSHGVLFLEQLALLVHSISEGSSDSIVGAMQLITKTVKEHARAVWENNKSVEKQMWDNILTISKNYELGKKPKFEPEILAKSEFLRMEKIRMGTQPAKEPIVIEAEGSDVDRKTVSTDGSPEPLLLTNPPPSMVTLSQGALEEIVPPKACTVCKDYKEKYGEDFLKAMREPERKFKILEIPEAEEEKETLFKMKVVPKFNYAVLKKFTLPTQPDVFDVTDPLKAALRVDMGSEEEEFNPPEGISSRAIKNPYVNRKRLIKY